LAEKNRACPILAFHEKITEAQASVIFFIFSEAKTCEIRTYPKNMNNL